MTITIHLEIGARERMWIALVLSVLIHLATLWKLPSIELSRSPEVGERTGPLVVQLMPPRVATPARPPSPPAAPRAQPRSQPRAQIAPRPAPQPAPRRPGQPARPTPPPVIARNEPAPALSVPQPRPVPQPPPKTPAAPATDFGSMVQSRQVARGESPEPAPPSTPSAASEPSAASKAEDENARANRIAAANLGLNRRPTFGPTPRGGGVFQITRRSYDYAEFLFYGWNKDIRRDTVQTIEVRKGNESDIRIAIIRRMIAIIRDHEQGDFIWESQRLNRNVQLSARPRDQPGLEAFLWREFFEGERP
jgi:hypothetical protein